MAVNKKQRGVDPFHRYLLILQGVPEDELPPLDVGSKPIIPNYGAPTLPATTAKAPSGEKAKHEDRAYSRASLLGHLWSAVEGFGVGTAGGLAHLLGVAADIAELPSKALPIAGAIASLGQKKDTTPEEVSKQRKELLRKAFSGETLFPRTKAIDTAYEKRVKEPLRSGTPSQTAFDIFYELGEWVPSTLLASVAGAPAVRALGLGAKGLEATGAATSLARRALSSLARKTLATTVRSAVEAPIATIAHDVGRKPIEAKELPKEIAWWAGSELALRGAGSVGRYMLGSLLRRKAAEEAVSGAAKAAETAVEESRKARGVRGTLQEALSEVREAKAPAEGVAAQPSLEIKLPDNLTPAEGVAAQPSLEIKLPDNLRRPVTSSYNYQRFTLKFENDKDLALYMVGLPKKSKHHSEYMDFLRKRFPGATDDDIMAAAREVHKEVRTAMSLAPARGTIRIEPLDITPKISAPATAQKATQKAAETAASQLEEINKEMAQIANRMNELLKQYGSINKMPPKEAEEFSRLTTRLNELAQEKKLLEASAKGAKTRAGKTAATKKAEKAAKAPVEEAAATAEAQPAEGRVVPAPEQPQLGSTETLPTTAVLSETRYDVQIKPGVYTIDLEPEVKKAAAGKERRPSQRKSGKKPELLPPPSVETYVEGMTAPTPEYPQLIEPEMVPETPQPRLELLPPPKAVEEIGKVGRQLEAVEGEAAGQVAELSTTTTKIKKAVAKTKKAPALEASHTTENVLLKTTESATTAPTPTPADTALNDLNVAKGSTVHVRDLENHPAVKSGQVTVKQLISEAKKRGANVEGEFEKLYASLNLPKAVMDALRRITGARNTKETFRPITEVSLLARSIDEELLEKLPDHKVVIDNKERTLREWLDKIDADAGVVNGRIQELVKTYGPPQFMPRAIRAKYDAYIKRLDKIAELREQLREPIEEALGMARKGKFSKDLSRRINTAKLSEGEIILEDAHGNKFAYIYKGPLSGREYVLSPVKEYAGKDEVSMLRTAPTLYARWFGLLRDVFGETIASAARHSLRKMEIFTTEYEEELFKILKPIIKNVPALERVTLILEGKNPVEAKPIEYEVASKLRKWYDRLFKEFGIDPERYLKDYAPRIRQYGGFISDAFAGKVPNELKFFAELEREAKELLFPRELNALTCALAYVRLGARKKFLQPFLEEVKPFVKLMSPERQRLWEDVVNSMLRRPVAQEIMINKMIDRGIKAVLGEVPPKLRGRYANAFANFITHLGYMGTLAGNIGAALKNMTQVSLAVFGLSNNPIEGIVYFNKALRALATKEGRQMLKFCWVLSGREYLEGLNRYVRPTVFGKIIRTAEKVGWAPFDVVEKFNVATSYMMKLLQSLEKGVPLGEAVEAANTFAANTQFLYGIDSPMISRTPLGRILGMFYSWPTNFVRLMSKYWNKNDWPKILTTFSGLLLTNWALEKITGLDFSSVSPARSILGWMPLAYLAAGEAALPVELITNIRNYISATLNAATSEDPTEVDRAHKEMINTLWSFVPFGVEIRRMMTVARAMENGGAVYDEEGRLRYRFGEIEVPGEEEPRRIGGLGGLIPEQVRALFGTTLEQRERREVLQEIIAQRNKIRELREKAFRVYMGEEPGDLHEIQRQIVELGGKPLTYGDVRQRLQEQQKEHEMTYAERIAQPMVNRGAEVQQPSIPQLILRKLLLGY